MHDRKQSVAELLETGMCYVPIDEQLVADATDVFNELIDQMLVSEAHTKFAIHRIGEDEPDLGLIYRSRQEGKDHKFFFHLAHDIELYLRAGQSELYHSYQQQLQSIWQLYKYLNLLSFELAGTVDDIEPGLFPGGLLNNILWCNMVSQPYAVPTLRGLFYPVAADQTGAKVHVDRNVFSIHLGDQGGSLIALDEKGEKKNITPPAGTAAVFFGAKAAVLTAGRIRPLAHGSDMATGQSRKAWVQFIQADVDFPVMSK